MNDLAATAEQLRSVREAMRRFLALWALEQMRERIRYGEAQTPHLDTAAVEAAILQLDLYGSESLASRLLADK